jgi:hypothetical protein
MLRIYSKSVRFNKAAESETPASSVEGIPVKGIPVKGIPVKKIEIPSSETQKLFIQIPRLRGKLFFFDEANVSW